MNGWKNYATWAVVNWGYDELDEETVTEISNDENLSETRKLQKIAELLEDQFNELAGYHNFGKDPGNTVFTDLFNYVVEQIDWDGIAAHIYADAVN